MQEGFVRRPFWATGHDRLAERRYASAVEPGKPPLTPTGTTKARRRLARLSARLELRRLRPRVVLRDVTPAIVPGLERLLADRLGSTAVDCSRSAAPARWTGTLGDPRSAAMMGRPGAAWCAAEPVRAESSKCWMPR